eukprot:CAMPEP_0174831780 /NCGR_PEP_ID=MMETSP1114-20130205/3299_1 /TAXON_ID=312471 /ORGANISM="Neobodo designis, Strain CCAP 1951/1" /LENGTH=230 /DNA_ID=CAMNT_0016065621 /DNA_START=66 /DNA_END=754 /DNA_ORIENTATION=-
MNPPAGRTPEPAVEPSWGKWIAVGGIVSAAAVTGYLLYQRCTTAVPPGFTAVVFSKRRCLVYRVVEGPHSPVAAPRRIMCPALDADAAFALVPTALVLDSTGVGAAHGRGVEMDVVAHGAKLRRGESTFSITVRLAFGVKRAELGRYLSFHEAGQPHERIAEVATAAILDAVRRLGDVDDEALLSQGRRARCFDDAALTAIRESAWSEAGVRVVAVTVANVERAAAACLN